MIAVFAPSETCSCPRSLPRAIIPAVRAGAESKRGFTCPKCGENYETSFSTGPRANCPQCQYEPTFVEFMERGGPSRWWFVLIVALALGWSVFATFATGIFR